MSRKTVKNLLIACIVIVILLSTMIIADFNYVLQKQQPIFCFSQYIHDDGGTVEYTGLGYKIISYNAKYGRHDIDLGPVFMSYDPQIDESKLKIEVDNKNKTYNFEGIVENIEVVDGKTILTVVSKQNEKQKVKIISGTLIYKNDFKSRLNEIIVGSNIKIRTSSVDSKKEIHESIAEIINIIE